MNGLLIAAAIAFFVLQSVSMKLLRAERLSEKLLVNGAFALTAGAGMAAAAVFVPAFGAVSRATLAWGLLFGLLFSLTILFYNLAVSSGPLSYTAFYFSASMLIPTLAGILFFHEPLRITLAGALLLFLAAFFFLNVAPRKKAGASPPVNRKWILFCILTFCCNGLLAVLQKCHQAALRGTESGGLMLVGFLTASGCYLIGFAVTRRREKGGRAALPLLKANRLPILLLAAGSLGGNLLLTFLAGVLPGSYLFPLVQGSIIVGVTLVSVLIFREKLSGRGRLAILLGTCAIVLINL